LRVRARKHRIVTNPDLEMVHPVNIQHIVANHALQKVLLGLEIHLPPNVPAGRILSIRPPDGGDVPVNWQY
jgi:hypothetical protein